MSQQTKVNPKSPNTLESGFNKFVIKNADPCLKLTKKNIGEMFGVTGPHIGLIVRKAVWEDVS